MGYRAASFLAIDNLIWLLGKLSYRKGKGHTSIVQITVQQHLLVFVDVAGPRITVVVPELIKVVIRVFWCPDQPCRLLRV